MPLKLVSILEQREVCDVTRWAYGLDFRDDGRQVVRCECLRELLTELVDIDYRHGARHARCLRDPCDVATRRRRGRKPTHRQQTLVVEHDMSEITRPVARERRERAEVHEDGA